MLAIRPLRPVRFDEADDPHRVELRIGRGRGVEQPDAAACRSAARRSVLRSIGAPLPRARLPPAADRRTGRARLAGRRARRRWRRARASGALRIPVLPAVAARSVAMNSSTAADLGRRTAGAADALEDRTELQRRRASRSPPVSTTTPAVKSLARVYSAPRRASPAVPSRRGTAVPAAGDRAPRSRRATAVRRAQPAWAASSAATSAARSVPRATRLPPPPRTPDRGPRRTARQRAAARRKPDSGRSRSRAPGAPGRGTAAAAGTRCRCVRAAAARRSRLPGSAA